MSAFEFCIHRPIFSTVLSLILVLIGIVSFDRLTVREFPNVDEPIVWVNTTYPGASAAIVETQVTQILEGSIAAIEGIDVLESSSRSESSRITVGFRNEINPDVAASDVRDRVSRVRGRLPDEISEPVITKVSESVAPKELKRFNQLRSMTVQANLAPGYTVGEGLAFLEQAARDVLPSTVQTDLSGLSRDFRASADSLVLVFVLAIAFIYLVLAAQFESFRDPLIILLTVPLSMTGALGALWLTGGTLNVYSQIGLVTLVGLITKHGILIVEFANQKQLAGLDRRAAVIEAATLRLRPILMTTGAMVLGAVPLALATGAGAENREQIGWVIVGGMSLGTVLTLFVVLSVYSYLGQRMAPQKTVEPALTPQAAE